MTSRPLAFLRSPLVLVLLTVLVAIGGITFAVHDTDDDGNPDTITIHVDTADRDRVPDDPLVVPVQAVDDAGRSDLGEHVDARDETPPGVSRPQLLAAEDQQAAIARAFQRPLFAPYAADTVSGCRTRYVSNQSSRGGVAPLLFVLHETVSPNRPGRGDVDGITAYFDRRSSGASSHFVIDHEGNCNYIVNLNQKAWTQATYNPVSVSVEMINTATGSEGSYAGVAGLKKLKLVWTQVLAREPQIRARKAVVSGCRVVQSGIVDHRALGACGGGHVDISPYALDPVVNHLLRPEPVAITSSMRATCRKLDAFRDRRARLRRQGLEPGPKRSAAALVASRAFDRKRLKCTTKGMLVRKI